MLELSGQRISFKNGSVIHVGSDLNDTLIIFEGPDDSLRQLLETANKTLALWGEEEDSTPKIKRYFILENFYPRSLDSRLTEMDPFIDASVNQSFGYVHVLGRSNTILTLCKVMNEYVAPQFKLLCIEMRYRSGRELWRFTYQDGRETSSVKFMASRQSEADEWLEP